MKKFLAIFLSALTLVVGLTACKEDKPKDNKTVNAEVNVVYELNDFFKADDSLYSVTIKTPFGKNFELVSRKVVFTELGNYQLTHVDGSITKINVLDTTAPVIRFNFFGFSPKAGEQCSLPISVVDNLNVKNYAVLLNGVDTNNVIIPTENGLSLTVKATDNAENSSVIKVELKPIGTVLRLDSTVFENLDQQKTYTFSYRITEYAEESSQTYLGSSITVKSGKTYSVKAVAKSGTETITQELYCIPII